MMGKREVGEKMCEGESKGRRDLKKYKGKIMGEKRKDSK